MKKFWSLRLFSVFGIRLELHLTFLILLLWVSWEGWRDHGLRGGLWSLFAIALIFLCVVLHELGHCLVARRYKVPIYRILLLPIGGMAQFGKIPRQPLKELLITIAGPAVNFALAGVLFLIIGQSAAVRAMDIQYNLEGLLLLLFVFNLLMGLFNLLPVFPMDGGRILRALLALRFSYLKATRMAVLIAKPLALAGILAAVFYLHNWITAALFAFIFIGGELEYSMVKRHESLRGLTVKNITRGDFFALPESASMQDVLNLHLQFPNRSFVVLSEKGPSGLLSSEEVALWRDRESLHPDVGSVSEKKITTLQAEWPLELFLDSLLRKKQKIFPVMHRGKLLGIVDLTKLKGF